MLKVWGRRSSFNVQKVMWLIGELELPHEHIDAGGSFGGLDTPAFLAMNPHGRVPVVADGDAVVWESHTILRYLAARHGVGRFWSDDPASADAGRGLDGLVANLAAAGFSQRCVLGILSHARGEAEHDRRSTPPSQGAQDISASSTGCSKGEAFMLGETLSLADITAGTSLYRYFELEIERPSVAAGRALVPHAAGAGSVPHPCHDPVRRAAREAGLLAGCRGVTSRSERPRP